MSAAKKKAPELTVAAAPSKSDVGEVPLKVKDLEGASIEQLLCCALGASGGTQDELVYWGLESIATDLEMVWEILHENVNTACAQAIHHSQIRLRVLAELHRRQVESLSAKGGAT